MKSFAIALIRSAVGSFGFDLGAADRSAALDLAKASSSDRAFIALDDGFFDISILPELA
jgi:hypothetical protein